MPIPRRELPEQIRAVPFTRQAGQDLGLTPAMLRGPALRRIGPRTYLSAEVEPSLRDLVSAQFHSLPASTLVDGVTALRLYGVEVGEPTPLRFCSTHRHQIRRVGVRVRRVRTLPPARGQLVAPVAALIAAAIELDLVDLVIAGEWLIRRDKVRLPRLVAGLKQATGRHARVLRRAAAVLRTTAESPQETRLRLMVTLAGLPEPVGNVTLGTDDYPVARVDLLLAAYQLVLEYEGDQHRTDRRQWLHDIGRIEWLQSQGYTVIRVTAKRMRQPRDLIADIHQSLVRAGYRGPAPDLDAEWCELFEAREC